MKTMNWVLVILLISLLVLTFITCGDDDDDDNDGGGCEISCSGIWDANDGIVNLEVSLSCGEGALQWYGAQYDNYGRLVEINGVYENNKGFTCQSGGGGITCEGEGDQCECG